jgi:Ca2+-binding RTX toxin-like protein
MTGYSGNDRYFVDNALDKAIEAAGGGTDQVLTSVSYALTANSEIETLSTTNAAGTTAINLTGNSLVQTIQGNNGANILDGKAGSDTLRGFGGSDTFRFSTTLGAGNIDHILDYNVAADTVQLENAVFIGLAGGTLAAAAFFKGSAAHDADDRIIYNAANGALIFDSNGNAAGGAMQFATVAAGLAMTNNEFFVT